MIEINMQMPEKCGLCPCFHAENPMYCQAVKADKNKRIVAPYGLPRPEWCPLKEQEPIAPGLEQTISLKTETGSALTGNGGMRMPDREKVIKGITHHKLGMCDMSGKICPYWNEDDGCSKKMLEDVLSLLKEQEAVEPINSYGTFRCGNCMNIVGYNDGNWRGYQNNFCSKCGKAVKWDA